MAQVAFDAFALDDLDDLYEIGETDSSDVVRRQRALVVVGNKADIDQAGRILENDTVAISAEYGPFAESVKTVSVSDGSNEASVQQLFQTQRVALNGLGDSVGGLEAQYLLKVSSLNDGQQSIAGIGLASGPPDESGVSSRVYVQADRFAIIDPDDADPDNARIPFIVQDGKVYIDTALIDDASISVAQIQRLIGSDNYKAGKSGWQITRDGDAEFNNGTFRGALAAASGTFSGTLTADAVNAINTINLAGNAVTVSAQVANSTTYQVGTSGGNAGTNTYVTTISYNTGAVANPRAQIVVTGVFKCTCDSGGQKFTVELVRGSTVIAEISVVNLDGSADQRSAVGVYSLPLIDNNLSIGSTYTYSLRIKCDNGNVSQIYNSIGYVGLKK